LNSVIVSRDALGEVHVLINSCRHRANAVCRYDYGNAQNFRCPYHGWVYKNSGENIGVVDRKRFPAEYTPEYTRSELSLLRFPHVATFRGLIFGCLDPHVPYDLTEYLGVTKKYLESWADRSMGAEFKVTRPHRYAYDGNWKFQAENGNDSYHVGFTHESALSTQEHFAPPDASRPFAKVSKGGTHMGFTYGHSRSPARPGAPLTASAGTRPGTKEMEATYREALISHYGEDRAAKVFDNGGWLFIFPNVYFFPNFIRVIVPISEHETEVASYPVKPSGLPDDIVSYMFLENQRILSTAGAFSVDDVEIFAANQTGLRSTPMEWLILNRGIGEDIELTAGEWASQAASDEISNRFFYREWARLVCAGE
jgi:phenylpropionate dioxygenase-like ring-hydroxylating dioxygenase large terminal subunit